MAFTVRDLLNQIYDATTTAIKVQLVAGSAAIGKLSANSGVDIGDVDVTSISAGETHVGSVGGEATIISVVMSMPAEAVDDNDVLAATQEIALAMRANGGTGVLQSIVVQDDDDNAGPIDIVIMDTNTAIGTEDSAVSMADNDTVLGIVSVLASDYVDMINSQVATMNNLGIVVKSGAASQSLFVGTVTRSAVTTTGSGMTLRFGFLQD